MQPNDFFGGGTGINDEGTDRSMSLEFHLNGETPPHYAAQEEDFGEDIRPMLNIENPEFTVRLRMYLKPKDANLSVELILLVADTVLAITYIAA